MLSSHFIINQILTSSIKIKPDNPFSLRIVPLVPGGLINHNSHLLYHFTPQMQEKFKESNQKFMDVITEDHDFITEINGAKELNKTN